MGGSMQQPSGMGMSAMGGGALQQLAGPGLTMGGMGGGPMSGGPMSGGMGMGTAAPMSGGMQPTMGIQQGRGLGGGTNSSPLPQKTGMFSPGGAAVGGQGGSKPSPMQSTGASAKSIGDMDLASSLASTISAKNAGGQSQNSGGSANFGESAFNSLKF